jgi:hypothetical protein
MNDELFSMLETALWSTAGYDDEHLDSRYSIEDIPKEFVDKCDVMLTEFMVKAEKRQLFDDDDKANIGHDFWLTLHRHGAGFWDGDYKNGDMLTELCQEFSELEDELRESLD